MKSAKPAAPAASAVEEPVQEEAPAPAVEEPEEVPVPSRKCPSQRRWSRNRLRRRPSSKRLLRPPQSPPQPEVRPAAAVPPPAPARQSPPPGRMVPPSIRLRIEEPNAPGTSAVPAMPTRPAASRLRPSDKVVPARPTAPLPPATGNLARPGGPGGGPGGISTRPAPQRPVISADAAQHAAGRSSPAPNGTDSSSAEPPGDAAVGWRRPAAAWRPAVYAPGNAAPRPAAGRTAIAASSVRSNRHRCRRRPSPERSRSSKG